MAIIKTIKENPYKAGMRWQAPDHFATEEKKKSPDYWKEAMDYYSTVAIGQYDRQAESIVTNYRLLNGYLTHKDFYGETKISLVPEAQELMEMLEDEVELPDFVKHYPIMNPPINELIGEASKRPDNNRVKAFDEEGKNEKIEFMTQMFQQYMEQIIRERVATKMEAAGQTEGAEDLRAMEEAIGKITEEQMAEYRTSFTTMAERWGNRMLEYLKRAFNIKEKREEGFRDMLVCSRQYAHILPDGSKIGFRVEIENAKNVWKLISSGKKYTRDAYAAGTIHIMELSEILDLYPFLTKEEVDNLNAQAREQYDTPVDYTSPLVQTNPKTGINSINYHPYDPAIEQRRMELEAMMTGEEYNDYLDSPNSIGHYGDRFTVVKAYWRSKKKMGKLTYLDEEGIPQTTLVDENYKKIPEEIGIEWGYINQWYEGVKIGEEVYYVQPLEILDYCPIIGVEYGNKNAPPASVVDLMKPYQMLFNVVMNQLWRLLEKERGNVFLTSIRHVPTPKDGDNRDALDAWMLDAQEQGIIFIDDSPENLKSPSAFNQHRNIDLSRSGEMQARLSMAEQIQNECWELIGLSRQRLGSTTSSETAQAINTALTQSYAQTEVYNVQHEYLWNQIYQAMLDAAVYIQLKNPESTLSYVSGEGEDVIIKIKGEELTWADLLVFNNSSAEDQRIFNEIRNLSQPMLQSGASFDLILEMYTTNSVRQLKDSVRSFQKKKDQFEQQAFQQKQQELEQQQQQFEANLAEQQRQHQLELETESYEKEQDRINKVEVAIVNQAGKANTADTGQDAYQQETLSQNQQKIAMSQTAQTQKMAIDQQKTLTDEAMKQANIRLQRDKMAQEERKMKLDKQMHDDKMKQMNKRPKSK